MRGIKGLVDAGKYFTINRARQYGKTTMLMALRRYLQKDYYVISMDFQTFGSAEFQTENTFAESFADSFLRLLKNNQPVMTEELKRAIEELKQNIREKRNKIHSQNSV